MSSAVLARRARSRSPPGRFDPLRPLVEEEHVGCEDDDMASALPEDMLLEVFRRLLPPPTAVFRCAAVCRRWRRLVGTLPAPARHFGFFRNYGPCVLPPFVPNPRVGVDLHLGFLPISPACGFVILDSRGHRLLLREHNPWFQTELRLLVCNPLEKSFAWLPAIPNVDDNHIVVACSTIVPGQGAEFRVAVVLCGATSPKFIVLVYSSASSAWELGSPSNGTLKRPLVPNERTSVVVEDVVYRLEGEAKSIIAVNTTKRTLSVLPLPNAGMLLNTGNCSIGKTEDGRLCLFAIREPLLLLKWVLLEGPPRKWAQQEPVALMNLVATVGDLRGMKLSAKIDDHGCELVRFGGFCEGTQALFFIMADRVVSLDLNTFRMESLWLDDDERQPVEEVFPYQMVSWRGRRPSGILSSVGALHPHYGEVCFGGVSEKGICNVLRLDLFFWICFK